MDTGWLEDFIAVAGCSNFSRAADQRNMTQPALSRRIQQLEAWVGTTLFNRDTHRISLTPAGECFHSIADEVLRRLQLGREETLEAAKSASTTLHFLSTHVLSLTFFPTWLRSLGSENLGGPISLVADTMQACERLMLQGAANFLLYHHHPAAATSFDPKNFLSHPLGMDTLVPVTAPDAEGKPRFTLPGSEAAPVPLLAYSDASGMGRILAASRIQKEHAGALTTVFTSHAAALLTTMALEGHGVAWAPLCIVAQDLEAGLLVRAGSTDLDVPLEVRLVRSRNRQTQRTEEFWRMIRGHQTSN